MYIHKTKQAYTLGMSGGREREWACKIDAQISDAADSTRSVKECERVWKSGRGQS